MVGKNLELRIGQTRLESLTVTSLSVDSPELSGELKSDSQLEIVERKKDGIIKVRLKEHFGFEPKGPLDIEISIVGRCKVDEGVTDDEVLETVRSAGYPLYAARSQVISYISGLTVGVPIIIPPYAYKPSGDRSGEKAVEAEIEVSE